MGGELGAPPNTGPSAGAIGEWAPRAVVIVHGIGHQRRGTARESLARAFQAAGAEQGKLIFKPGAHGEPPKPSARPVTHGPVRADVYEVYWAPLTANKTTVRSVSGWLLGATFLRGDAIRWPSRKAWLDLGQFFGYLAAGILIVLLALNMLGNLSHEASCSLDPGQKRCPAETRAVEGGSRGETGATSSVWGRLEETFGALGRAWAFADRPLQDLTPSNAADTLKQLSILTWLALVGIAWATAQVVHRVAQILLGPRRGAQFLALLIMLLVLLVLMQLVRGLFIAFVWVITIVAVAIRATSRFLSEDFGDIEVYVNQDENKKFFEARKAVINETENVFRVLDERGYQEIIVFGHSLGSVVAFDVLVDSELPEQFLDRVKGFVTFGSAWEKVRYFFDRKSGDPETGERRRFVNRALNKIETNMWWLNVWNTTDWVANPITTHRKEHPPVSAILRNADDQLPWVWENLRSRVVNLHRLSVWPFPRSHSRYLQDRKVQRLLTGVAFAGDVANLGGGDRKSGN